MQPVPVKVIAMTQERRGHGVSTAAYFLGQALAQQQVPVLLADLTDRHTHLQLLSARFPPHQMVVWSPRPQAMRDMPAMLTQARAQVSGKASAIMLDVDVPTLDGLLLGTRTAGVDYLLIAAEYTADGQKSLDRVAARYETLGARDRIGVAFARLSRDESEELPAQTNGKLPVLGYWPADYRLAMVDDYQSAPSGIAQEPHQPYLAAITRLATRLIRLVPLARALPARKE